MSGLDIQTTQNVQLQYATASLGDRIAAFLIDSVIIGVYAFIVIFSIASGLDSEAGIWLMIAMYIPLFFYHLASEVFMQGQSLGKKQMNIKVVKLDGSPATLGSYILRWILRPVDNFFYGGVAMITIAVGGKGQRLGDLAAGTTVVKLNKKVKVHTHDLIKKLEEDYEPVFTEVVNLSDRDIEIIRRALEINRETANIEPVLKVEKKIKDTLQVTSSLPPVKFLYTIIKDHQHLTSKI